MSLCIATSVPDGIVLVSDTLQTMNGALQQQIQQTCTACKSPSNLTVTSPIPFGTFPTAQKQHHLKIVGPNSEIWSLGILNAGALNIGNHRVSKLIRDFESTIKFTDKIDDIANNLKINLEQTIVKELQLLSCPGSFDSKLAII